MANTTFSGPVRSYNGFLEWDGTAWVPVQGGGGGGETATVLPAVDGDFQSLEVPVPTAVGQKFLYAGAFGLRGSGSALSISVAPSSEYPGGYLLFGTTASPSGVDFTANSGGALTVGLSDVISYRLELVFTGIQAIGSANISAIFAMNLTLTQL